MGIELDRHLSVQLSDNGPLFGNLAVFLNRAHDSDALPETVNAGGGARQGDEIIDPDLKPFHSNEGRYKMFIFA